MKIGVHGKFFSTEHCSFIQQIFDELHRRDTQIFLSRDFNKVIKKTSIDPGQISLYKPGDDLSQLDFMFSIGGDGTFLDTITHVGAFQTPLLGINIGRLGFLASTTEDNFRQVFDLIYQNRYKYEYRTLVHLDANKDLFNGLNFGLNEFAILKKDTSSMITVHTYVDGDYLNSYWADGLIISTPTGSTGYSLSCGGPFVLPHSNNFIITPVSAHNLNIRPMVVSDNSVITIEVEGRSKYFLASLDSRSCTIDASVKMSVRKEDFKAKLVKFEGYNFFDTLRQKLNWGLDARN
ncbi:MAG: NAD kinase [Candidatus Cyclobacteriaceae bacterium M3_2C_046]